MKKLALVALALALRPCRPRRCRLRRRQGAAGRHRHGRRCADHQGAVRPVHQPGQGERRTERPAGLPEPRHHHLQPLRRRDRQLPGRAAGRAERGRQRQDHGHRRAGADASSPQIAAQYGGTQKMYAAAKKAGMDPAQLKTYVKDSLIGQKLYQKIIGNLDAHRRPRCRPTTRPTRATFDQAATRTVRHVLVKTKAEALQGAGPAHRQQHQRQLGQGGQEVLDRHRHQEQRRQPRRHPQGPDGQALRKRRLLGSRSTRSRRRSTRSTAGT